MISGALERRRILSDLLRILSEIALSVAVAAAGMLGVIAMLLLAFFLGGGTAG